VAFIVALLPFERLKVKGEMEKRVKTSYRWYSVTDKVEA